MFNVSYADEWDKNFIKFDKTQQDRIWKRIQQLAFLPSTRHLKHGLPFFVLEAGQYRICYRELIDERIVIFVGTHKQYEKWYKEQ